MAPQPALPYSAGRPLWALPHSHSNHSSLGSFAGLSPSVTRTLDAPTVAPRVGEPKGAVRVVLPWHTGQQLARAAVPSLASIDTMRSFAGALTSLSANAVDVCGFGHRTTEPRTARPTGLSFTTKFTPGCNKGTPLPTVRSTGTCC